MVRTSVSSGAAAICGTHAWSQFRRDGQREQVDNHKEDESKTAWTAVHEPLSATAAGAWVSGQMTSL
jgi:hypothetical protein